MSSAYVPIPGLEDWQQQQQQQQQQVDRIRFERHLRLAQGNLEAVQCHGCKKVLSMRHREATMTFHGVVRCGPCRRRAEGRW